MTGNPKQPNSHFRIEPRWPAMLALLVLFSLLVLLPDRFKLLPVWFLYFSVIAILIPMFAITLTGGTARWRRIERIIILIFFILAVSVNLISLTYLIETIINGSTNNKGLKLFSSSISMWVINMITFSLSYWQLDCGGPEARLNHSELKPDWLFPQTGIPNKVPPNWQPMFVDYLFLAFSTATTFGPTDVLPITHRAKILMMLESAIALITIVVVASRAIGILGN